MRERRTSNIEHRTLKGLRGGSGFLIRSSLKTKENDLQRSHLFWRWALIGSEILIVCNIVFGRSAPHHRVIISPSPIIDAAVVVALAFLLFGSPFLVRSQGGLATLGWFVAVSAILAPIL